MDKFRILVQSVGNALGFIRLVRSASLNTCSKNIGKWGNYLLSQLKLFFINLIK